MISLDDAVKAATAAEATLTADEANLANLQAAVAQAQAPVPAAQAKVANDAVAFNSALDNLISAAQAAKVPVS